jgi:hypothetical protein
MEAVMERNTMLTMTFRVIASGAIAMALIVMTSPWEEAAAAMADKDLKLSGCLVRGEGDGDPFLLTNKPMNPALVSGSANVAPTGVGTAAEFRNVFYWLDGDGSLKDHVGHFVEIEGQLKGDVKEGEIKLDRKDNWTELTVKADGRSMKARVPNLSVVPAGKNGGDAKGPVAVRRVDVDHIRMLSASCES